MSVRVNIRIFKFMLTPIKLGVRTYATYVNCRTLLLFCCIALRDFLFCYKCWILISLIGQVILLDTVVAMFHFGTFSEVFQNKVLIANVIAL